MSQIPDLPPELVDEWTERLGQSIAAEIDMEIKAELDGKPVNQADIQAMREKFAADMKTAYWSHVHAKACEALRPGESQDNTETK